MSMSDAPEIRVVTLSYIAFDGAKWNYKSGVADTERSSNSCLGELPN